MDPMGIESWLRFIACHILDDSKDDFNNWGAKKESVINFADLEVGWSRDMYDPTKTASDRMYYFFGTPIRTKECQLPSGNLT